MKFEVTQATDPFKATWSKTNIKKATKSSVDATFKQFLKEVESGFDQETTPGGAKWASLNPDYQKFKMRKLSGKKILEGATLALKAAALHPAVEFSESSGGGSGSGQSSKSDGYSISMVLTPPDPDHTLAYQEFGAPGADIPARPFFDVEGAARDRLDEATIKEFEQRIGI